MIHRKLLATIAAILLVISMGGGTAAIAAAQGDVPTITVVLLCMPKPTDLDIVTEAINKITVEKIGVKIELLPIEIGNYASQLPMLLTGGSVDVYAAGFPGSAYPAMATTGQAIPLDDYLAPYAEEIKEAISPEVYNCGLVNGKMYGVPRYLDFASSANYSITKEIADKYGLTNGQNLSLDEITELFTKVRADGITTPLIGTAPAPMGAVIVDSRCDSLGDMNLLGVLNQYGQTTKIVNYYESPEYLDLVAHYKQWKELNAYMPDPLNNTEAAQGYIASGRCLGLFASHFDAIMNSQYASQNYGQEMYTFKVFDAVAATPGFIYCVSPACKVPDKATAWLYLQATDADIENLLCLGIEGVHYVVDSDGVARYPEGKDASNSGWSMGFAWSQLNSPLTHPFQYAADYYNLMVEANQSASYSKAFGCIFDTTAVTNELTACTNVVLQYKAAIECGAFADIDKAVSDFQEALKDAGIDAIIANKQAQLDAFLAARK